VFDCYSKRYQQIVNTQGHKRLTDKTACMAHCICVVNPGCNREDLPELCVVVACILLLLHCRSCCEHSVKLSIHISRRSMYLRWEHRGSSADHRLDCRLSSDCTYIHDISGESTDLFRVWRVRSSGSRFHLAFYSFRKEHTSNAQDVSLIAIDCLDLLLRLATTSQTSRIR
jgi:hypothetical protein